MIRTVLLRKDFQNHIAIIEAGTPIHYRDILQKAAALQYALLQRQDERIALCLPNGSAYIAALFAILMSGKTAMPLHAHMTHHEIIPLLKQCSIRTIVVTNASPALPADALQGIHCIRMEEMPPAPPLYQSIAIKPDIGKPMMLFGTSGTTGASKIVQLSEQNVEACVLGYVDKMCVRSMTPGDARFILATPFSSAYGMMILSTCLLHAFPIIPAPEPFTLDAFFQTAQAHRATHYEGGTAALMLMEQMAGRPNPYDIHTLQYFGFGGSKMAGSTIKRILDAYPGIGLYLGYGMTEASPLITKHAHCEMEKHDSVGNAISGVRLGIDIGGQITREPNRIGEIVVQGPNVMMGYLNDETATSAVLKNGYLYTGDIGYLDAEGYLYISGRKKNIIIVRGLNVHPEEVETCILQSALAKDCRVYAQIDSAGNELVCADVLPAHENVLPEDIQAYCGTHLADYKQPQRIRLCDAIPRNHAGKIDRQNG